MRFVQNANIKKRTANVKNKNVQKNATRVKREQQHHVILAKKKSVKNRVMKIKFS